MKQHTVLKCVGVVIAVLACTGLFYFLSLFGRTSSRVTYLNWDSVTLTVNGQLQDAPELSDPTIPLSQARVLPATARLCLSPSDRRAKMRPDRAPLWSDHRKVCPLSRGKPRDRRHSVSECGRISAKPCMTKPPSRTKNRGGGFMWAQKQADLSYDKLCVTIDLTYDKQKAIMILR